MKTRYSTRQTIYNYLSQNKQHWHTIDEICSNVNIPKDTIYYYLESILNSPGGKDLLDVNKQQNQPNEYKALQ